MDEAVVEWRGAFEDAEIQAVHNRAFEIDPPNPVDPWTEWLNRHSLGWVTARHEGRLIGFLNVVTDGGVHAWLQDVVVEPDHQRGGVGEAMVELASRESGAAGCEWLHVDFDEHLTAFYLDRCKFQPTSAGLRYLQ
ncbi:MAG: GNAT family N-acetyltransferase [Actinomycetota bacterium]